MGDGNENFGVCSLVAKAGVPLGQPVKIETDGPETSDNEAIYDYTLRVQKRSSTESHEFSHIKP